MDSMVFHGIISIEMLVFNYKNNKHKVFISDELFSLIFSQTIRIKVYLSKVMPSVIVVIH